MPVLTNEYDEGDYHVVLTAEPKNGKLIVTLAITISGAYASDSTRYPDNVLVWLDGDLAVSFWDVFGTPKFRGHWIIKSGGGTNTTYTIILDPTKLVNPTPGTRKLTVQPLDSNASGLEFYRTITWAELTVTLPSEDEADKFVRTMFFLSQEELSGNPTLVAQVKAAGINTVSLAVFQNPIDTGHNDIDSFTTYTVNGWLIPRLQWCKDNGFEVLATGDDFMRTADERSWLQTYLWGKDAIQLTAATCTKFGVLGIEVVDESAGVVGDPPPAFVKTWYANWREANGPPVAWPDKFPYSYEVQGIGDYASRYWTDTEFREGERGRILTTHQTANGLERAALNLPRGWRRHFQVDATGPLYRKHVAGGDYQTGDLLLKGGVTAGTILAQCWVAAAFGANGIRAYFFDAQVAAKQRRVDASTAGDIDLETGTAPGDARWAGMAAAFQSLAEYEEALSGMSSATADVDGPWVVGRRGALQWWVNVSGRALPRPSGITVVGTVLWTPSGKQVYNGKDVPADGVLVRGG